MLIRLVFALAVLAAVLVLWHKYKTTEKSKRKKFLTKAALFTVAGAVLIGVVTGRMHWLGAVFAALIPFLRFGLNAGMRFVPLWMANRGGNATFKTQYLEVQFDVRQAVMSGRVIAGPHAGRELHQLNSEALSELEALYKEQDSKSYYLIRAFRQRGAQQQNQHHQNDSRHQADFQSFGMPAREEAMQILGLKGQPSKEDIIAAHRRLINKLHPDRGGNDYLASRVNLARDLLLKDLH